MKVVYETLRYLTLSACIVLGLVIFAQWRRRRDEGSKWAFLTFGTLGLIAIAGLFLPQEGSDSDAYQWSVKALIAALAFFPYFLFRISSSFGSAKTWTEPAALTIAALVSAWALLLGRIPRPGEPRPESFRAWLVVFVIFWMALSAVVAVRFWRAGTDQPAVARKRMRMLSIASMMLSIGIAISGFSGGEIDHRRQSLTQAIALVSIVTFYLAFAPPGWLRRVWRRPVEEELRRGALDLMASETSHDVLEALLPRAIGIVGGKGIAVVDPKGKVIGARGMDPASIARAGRIHLEPAERTGSGLIHLEFPFGAMVVQTGPYTPFFGQDEIELLGALGALANLALSRVAAGDLRMQLERATIRRQQALEINDNIVQGLAVAKYSFDLGDQAKAREAIEGTLVAARSIISGLLDDFEGEADLGPGTLTRDRAATGFTGGSSTREPDGAEPPP